jgi:hypothetical protein
VRSVQALDKVLQAQAARNGHSLSGEPLAMVEHRLADAGAQGTERDGVAWVLALTSRGQFRSSNRSECHRYAAMITR